jgi:uncharacterized protein
VLTVRFGADLPSIGADAWDALRPTDDPFVSHAFLAGLEAHGCIQPRHGWQPHHLTVHDGERLVAAAPCYLKRNSHGEFVFDHGWAEAYWRHGLDYYPKLLCAVPYSPVPGPRLLCGNDADGTLARRCLDALEAEVRRLPLSSAHVNFIDPAPADLPPGWLPRFDWQFHWQDRGWTDFDHFLAALSARKRKNIRRERAQVAEAGISVRRLHGDEASEAELAQMFGFYLATFVDKGNMPVLTLAFLQHLATSMPRRLLLVLAERAGETIAGALFLRSADTLFGRYWGCSEPWPGLHFELCYYQGIDYCLEHGLARFQPGAQGEHKLARGFLPTATHSLHHLADPRFHDAVADALQRESAWLLAHRQALLAQSPYRGERASADAPGVDRQC